MDNWHLFLQKHSTRQVGVKNLEHGMASLKATQICSFPVDRLFLLIGNLQFFEQTASIEL